jgi:hypothetical protein
MAKRTIRIRSRKSRTIRKVMRGCNGRGRGRGKRGGGREAVQYPNASDAANRNLAVLQAGTAQANQAAGNSPPQPTEQIKSNMAGGQATTITEPFGVGGNISSTYGQVGGSHHRRRSKTRHQKRKLRYKKSVARKSRRS